MPKITGNQNEDTLLLSDDKDYIPLTDMVRNIEKGPARTQWRIRKGPSAIAMVAAVVLLIVTLQSKAAETLSAEPFTIFPALGKGISAEAVALSSLILFSESKVPNKLKVLLDSEELEGKYECEVKDTVDFYMLRANAYSEEIKPELSKYFAKVCDELSKSIKSYGIAMPLANDRIPENLPLIQASLENAKQNKLDMRGMCRQAFRKSFLLEDVRELGFSPARAIALLRMHHPFLLWSESGMFICVLCEYTSMGTEWYGYDVGQCHEMIEFTGQNRRGTPQLTRLATDGCRMLYIPDLALNTRALTHFIRSLMHEKGYMDAYIERD